MSSKKIRSNIMSKDSEGKDSDNRTVIKLADRPTFILKTREGESRALSPSQRNGNKKETEAHACQSTKSSEPRFIISMCVEMTNCIKFVDGTMQLCDGPLEFLYDQQDFLVVGCLGTQGVGKSTIMSLLASSETTNLFPIQNLLHQESGSNCTSGVDLYVTKNRVIYLDTQPILSSSVMDSTLFDQKKGSNDFGNAETNMESQSLQFTAFLFSVCHVIIFIQDWFVDPNLVRFLQTAEMLKPASTTTMDQDYAEYYPHILFLHNKAELHDFIPKTLNMMKNFYNKVFRNSRLQTHSGFDMSSSSTEGQLNLFLIPSIESENDPKFYENRKQLISKLRNKIHGVARNAMTPSSLTEKNWYYYVSKVIEVVKKSHFSSEYGRLMP